MPATKPFMQAAQNHLTSPSLRFCWFGVLKISFFAFGLAWRGAFSVPLPAGCASPSRLQKRQPLTALPSMIRIPADDADFYFGHVQPTGVLGRVVEL